MNITIDMGQVLVKAWKIIWKFKVLWIFGILAGCAVNNGSSFNGFNGFNNNFGNPSGSNGNIPMPTLDQLLQTPQVEALRSFLSLYLTFIVLGAVLLCAFWLFLYFLGIMGRIGLIKGAGKADAGAEELSFGELWNESLPHFWRVFGLVFLVGLPFFLVAVVVLVVVLAGVYSFIANGETSSAALPGLMGAMAIFLPLICCLGVLRFVVDMIVQQSQNAIVLEDKGILESLRRGWEVFKRSFLTIILITIILGVLGGIVSFVVAIPLLLIFIPAAAAFVGLAVSSGGHDTGALLAPLLIAGGCTVLYLPVLWLLRGIEQSYIQSVWTLTYLRLTAPAPAAPAAVPETAHAG